MMTFKMKRGYRLLGGLMLVVCTGCTGGKRLLPPNAFSSFAKTSAVAPAPSAQTAEQVPDNRVVPASYVPSEDEKRANETKKQSAPPSFLIRAQDQGWTSSNPPDMNATQPTGGVQPATYTASPQGGGTGSYPYPTNATGGSLIQDPQPDVVFEQPITPIQNSGTRVGDPNAVAPGYLPDPPAGVAGFVPQNYADLDIYTQGAPTGRFMIGGAYNSDSGITGNIIIDERNFDIRRFPRSWDDVTSGRAWRGRGQAFRMELLPGREVQRYMVSFSEPYLFDSNVSFSASAYFYDRRFLDWDEQRLGGTLSLGYRLTPNLSVSVGTRMENVDIHDPRVNTSPELNAVLGDNEQYLGFVKLTRDTRDHPFMATEGSYMELTFTQSFGDFDYSRGDLDWRTYRLLYERPDGSGRHTLSFGTRLGFSGSATPLFENYFAGGFSTMRGFDFRGASPTEGGVRVGGEFQWLNSLEYVFPLTADDMIKGVVFCDFGTVEREIQLTSENFRVAPGFGFRIHMPAAGQGGAPLAFDFAFPVADATHDDRQMFSFYLGILR